MSDIASDEVVVWAADGNPISGLDYGDRLSERLGDLGFAVTRRDLTAVRDGDAAASHVPGTRLHVLTGGSTSVNERSGWMPHGIAFVRQLIAGAERGEYGLVGICLGSQMIAEALWPGCVSGGKAIEVGLTEIEVQGGGSLQSVIVPNFHYEETDADAVRSGGGEITASNAHCTVQAFRYGEAVRAMQCHPEFDPSDVRRLVEYNRATIEEYGGSVDAALSGVDKLEPYWSRDTFGRLFTEALPRRWFSGATPR